MNKYIQVIFTCCCTLGLLTTISSIKAQGIICPSNVQFNCYDAMTGAFKGTVSAPSSYSKQTRGCIPGSVSGSNMSIACSEIHNACNRLPVCNNKCVAGEANVPAVKSCRGIAPSMSAPEMPPAAVPTTRPTAPATPSSLPN